MAVSETGVPVFRTQTDDDSRPLARSLGKTAATMVVAPPGESN